MSILRAFNKGVFGRDKSLMILPSPSHAASWLYQCALQIRQKVPLSTKDTISLAIQYLPVWESMPDVLCCSWSTKKKHWLQGYSVMKVVHPLRTINNPRQPLCLTLHPISPAYVDSQPDEIPLLAAGQHTIVGENVMGSAGTTCCLFGSC